MRLKYSGSFWLDEILFIFDNFLLLRFFIFYFLVRKKLEDGN
jgi:hypothetical protein